MGKTVYTELLESKTYFSAVHKKYNFDTVSAKTIKSHVNSLVTLPLSECERQNGLIAFRSLFFC